MLLSGSTKYFTKHINRNYWLCCSSLTETVYQISHRVVCVLQAIRNLNYTSWIANAAELIPLNTPTISSCFYQFALVRRRLCEYTKGAETFYRIVIGISKMNELNCLWYSRCRNITYAK